MHFISRLFSRKTIISILVSLLALVLVLILIRGSWLIILIDAPYYWPCTNTVESDDTEPATYYISTSPVPTEVDATITIEAGDGPAAYLGLFRRFVLNPSSKPNFLLVTSDNHAREHHIYISSHASNGKSEIVKVEILNVPHWHERAYPNTEFVSR